MQKGEVDVAGGVRGEPRLERGGFGGFALAVEGAEGREGTEEDGDVGDRGEEGEEVDHFCVEGGEDVVVVAGVMGRREREGSGEVEVRGELGDVSFTGATVWRCRWWGGASLVWRLRLGEVYIFSKCLDF